MNEINCFCYFPVYYLWDKKKKETKPSKIGVIQNQGSSVDLKKSLLTVSLLVSLKCLLLHSSPAGCNLVSSFKSLPLFIALSMERTSTLRSHVLFSVYPSMFMPRAFFKGNKRSVSCSKYGGLSSIIFHYSGCVFI